MIISVIAAIFTEETFHKELNYIERLVKWLNG